MNLIEKCLIINLILFAIKVETYRILGIFPLSFKSHNMFFESVMRGLAKKGHEVDVISHFEVAHPTPNYRTIINLANLDYDYPRFTFNNFQEAVDASSDIISLASEYYGLKICNIMSHETFQKFIRNLPNDPPYDVIITESFTTSCYYGFGPLLKVPLVTISACLDLPQHSRMMGNPLPTSFFSSIVYKREIKTFWDRLGNTWRTLIDTYRFNSYTESQSVSMKKYLSPNSPSVREVERMTALYIINTFHTLHGIRPKVPAFIEVGGLHIEQDVAKLTPDLKKWMDESNDGVVLMSLGTLVPVESFPKETIRSIFSSFGKLAPIRFLIKTTKGYKFPFKPPNNVLTLSWVPQIPVLRHQNTRLFISHGGIHSIMEAVYFGVPVIGTPIFFDQLQNIGTIVTKNMSLQLDYKAITEIALDKALQEILTDSKYKKAAKYESKLFRERPESPIDSANYWIEYVVRNGENSLRASTVDLYWWQVDQLDTYGFLFLCLILMLYIIKIIIVTIFKNCVQTNIKPQLKTE